MKMFVWAAVAACGAFASVSAAQAADATEGQRIFNEICSHCHNSTSADKIGPGLAGITKRRSIAWIGAWLKDPNALIKTDDYAKKLRQSNKYGMTMPAMPIMKDDQMRADVIEYLKTL